MTTQATPAQLLADQLNAYTGDNAWQDIVEASDYDRAATEAADPSGQSMTVVMPGGDVVSYDEASKSWSVE